MLLIDAVAVLAEEFGNQCPDASKTDKAQEWRLSFDDFAEIAAQGHGRVARAARRYLAAEDGPLAEVLDTCMEGMPMDEYAEGWIREEGYDRVGRRQLGLLAFDLMPDDEMVGKFGDAICEFLRIKP